jgi:NPCBM/NEW2 domain
VYDISGDGWKTFASDIGLDEEVGSNGSVIFKVYLDGSKVYDSGTLTGSSGTKSVSLDIAGENELKLVVTSPDNKWFDHADWANAKLAR